MRWVSMPMSAAAWRSCAVAMSASPVSVRARNHQSATKAARASALAASCGRPTKTPPSETRPASHGSFTTRKSTPQTNCAPARSSTASPKVAKTCASIGPPSTQRMMPW